MPKVNAETGEIVFNAKYGARHVIASVSCAVFAATSIPVAISVGDKDPKAYLCLLFIPAGLFIWMSSFKRIRFGPSEIVCERYFLPAKILRNRSEKSLGSCFSVVSTGCTNSADLWNAMGKAEERGDWQPDEQERADFAMRAEAGYRAALIGFPVAVVLSIAAVWFRPFGFRLHWFLWSAIFYLPLGSALYFAFLRRRRSGH